MRLPLRGSVLEEKAHLAQKNPPGEIAMEEGILKAFLQALETPF